MDLWSALPRTELCCWSALLATLSLLLPVALAAQQAESHRNLGDNKYTSRAALGKGVTRAELSNGMTVLVRENHAAPVATVRCFVRNTGSSFEGRFLGTGISHMLEHLVAGGSTKNRQEAEIQELLDTMGGRTNAFTSTDRTGFYIDCPSRQIDLALELIADSMQNSTIPEDEYTREMGVVQRELEMGQADRSRRRYQAMKSLIFTRHPMRHPIIGYLPVVQSVQRKDVVAFYKNRYVPQNMVFVVVGDVDTDQVLDQVLSQFSDFQRTTERGAVLASEPQQASPRSTRFQMEGQTTHFSIGWPTVALQDPDLYPLDVISDLLTNGDSSRLVARLRIDQPLAVSVTSASYTPGFVAGWFDVTLQCKPENLETCREIVLEEILRLQNEPVTEEDLAKVKRQQAAMHVFAQQTVQAQANSLAASFMATGDPLFDEQYVQGIQKVTAEQVLDVARRYFLAERQNRVIIDPPGDTHDQADVSAEGIESDVLRTQLDNGLTVLLKRHAVTPTVSIQAFVRGGVLTDTRETSGRAALASELMTRGTEKYSGRQIASHFDSTGGVLVMSSQRNTSFLQCSILKDDFDTALDYVRQVLFEPTFPAEEFEKVQQQQLNRIAARKADPRAEIMDFWTQNLPDETPYSRTVVGVEDSVSQLTVADCKEYHRSFVVPNNMVLAIYGDIDPEVTLSQIRNLFGPIPASPDVPFPTFADQHEKSAGRSAHLTNQRENTALVLVSYGTVNIRDTKTRNALQVLSAILTGGGGAGGRLFNELRGQRLVYYVFGQEMTGLAPGFYFFLAQTLPQTREEVTQRIQASLTRISEEGVPKEEFERTKQKLIAQHAMQNTTPRDQAFQASIYELYGLGYEHDDDYDERIQAVTVADVQNVIQQYFHDPVIVSSSPAE